MGERHGHIARNPGPPSRIRSRERPVVRPREYIRVIVSVLVATHEGGGGGGAPPPPRRRAGGGQTEGGAGGGGG
ncbi:hypothetical protein, partial [Nocardia wallacei]|uniref:hypothetical protein n=1 Tax=Nocardia wallacei TaxID=480035 RepID=UPI002453F788